MGRWFGHSGTCIILDTPVRIAPLEEVIWQKAYIMDELLRRVGLEQWDAALKTPLHFRCRIQQVAGREVGWSSAMTLKQIKEWTQAGVKQEDPARDG
jgi:hypothetical protein